MGRSGYAVVVVAAALLASATVADPAGARSGAVRVSGGSISTIELRVASGRTARDGDAARVGARSARFGTNLTPDGTPSDSPDGITVHVDPSDPSVGACYAWAGSVTVRSNRPYAVSVTASAANDRLRFLTDDPRDFGSCAGGEPVGPRMFAGADPAGAWVTGQGRTPLRAHDYWLGLELRWEDPPSVAIVQMTLTFSAVPSF
jgi:hypothetical protein